MIDRTYPLEDVVEAHRYVDTHQKVGNVVLLVSYDLARVEADLGGHLVLEVVGRRQASAWPAPPGETAAPASASRAAYRAAAVPARRDQRGEPQRARERPCAAARR